MANKKIKATDFNDYLEQQLKEDPTLRFRLWRARLTIAKEQFVYDTLVAIERWARKMRRGIYG